MKKSTQPIIAPSRAALRNFVWRRLQYFQHPITDNNCLRRILLRSLTAVVTHQAGTGLGALW